MTPGNNATVIAACTGLSAFVVGVVAGLAVENPIDVILTRGLVAMAVCLGVGYAVGTAAEQAFSRRLGELRARTGAAGVPTSQTSAVPRERGVAPKVTV